MDRSTFAALAALVVAVFLAEYVTASSSAGFRFAQSHKIDAASFDQTCLGRSLKICPPPTEHLSLSSHVRCIMRNRHRFVRWCREFVDGHAKCLDDMEEFCPDLEYDETMTCLNDHVNEVSQRCVSSLLFKFLHRQAGRDTEQYRQAYTEETDANARTRDEPGSGDEL